MGLSISEKGLAFVAAREACVLTVYADTHLPAIGFGQNDPTLKPRDTITLDRAIAMFVKKANSDAGVLSHIFKEVPLDQNHVDALWSLGYNIGFGAIGRNQALLAAVKAFRADPKNRKLRDGAAFEIVCANLTQDLGPFNLSRRCREALVFIAGDYGDLSVLNLWDADKSPKNNPPDPARVVAMPVFLKG